MNEVQQTDPSRDTIAWFSMIASILLPLLCSFILFKDVVPVGREGGANLAKAFAVAEVATIIGGIAGFIVDTDSSRTGRTLRLIITIVAGSVGTVWLVALSGFAGMGP